MARSLVVKLIGDASSLEKELRKADRGVSRFTRDIDKAGRGALAGTGLFRSFGRSIAFASGGFLAFASASQFLRASVDAAREAAVAQRALGAQMKASGESFKAHREEIEKVSLAYGKYGFQNDEVIASLTVLERGTGNITKAIGLQGLTADLARAKNIDLAAAAQTVAKVFGGQETALRRAVPGLEKNAHGWDLIRLAQAKLAGQAAANTTAAEKFAAELHNTEEIIGQALLPTLNRYLDSLSKWMSNTKNQHELAKQVKNVLGAIGDVVGVVSAAFKDLNKITGGTKDTFKLLLGFWITFKSLKLAGYINSMAREWRGLNAAQAEGAAAAAGGAGGAGGRGASFTAAARRLPIAGAILSAGLAIPHPDILNKSLIEIVSGLFRDSKKVKMPAGALGPVTDKVVEGISNALTEATKRGPSAAALKRMAALRRQWFSARIERMISRSQYAGLREQLGTLQDVAGLLTRRIAATKDITTRLDLEDKLLQVRAQAKDVRQQIAQRFIDALQFNVTKAGATTTLNDDIAALLKLQAFLRQRAKIAGNTLELQQQQLDVSQQLKQVREQRMANFIDALQFNVEKAGATARLSDDLRALRVLQAVLKRRIAAEQGNLDLQRQLLGVQQQITDVVKQQAQRRQEAAQAAAAATATRQFKALGFGPGGADLIPSAKTLRKQLGSIVEAVRGTFLDTDATRGLLNRIRRVLSGSLGRLGKDVREKIKQLLDDLASQLQQGPDGGAAAAKPWWTKYGLSAEPFHNLYAPTIPMPPGVGAAGGTSYQIDNLNLFGVHDVRALEEQLLTRAGQRPQTRRGPV